MKDEIEISTYLDEDGVKWGFKTIIKAVRPETLFGVVYSGTAVYVGEKVRVSPDTDL